MTYEENEKRGENFMIKAIIPVLTLIIALTSCDDPSAGSGVPEFLRDVKTVSAGYMHTAAIKEDGTLWVWGFNDSGQLGLSTPVIATVPIQIEGKWKAVSAGWDHTAAIKTDGTLWAWGNNWFGQLGDGTTINSNTPVQESTHASNWVTISAGGGHTVAIKTDGSLWTWGWNILGQLGLGDTTNRETPVQVLPGTTWETVSAGDHTAAIKTDGSLWAWGKNTYGQLGDGTTIDSNTPVQESTHASNWVTVSAGYDHTVAIKTDGSLWTWGDNSYGKLGLGDTTINSNTPVQESTHASNWVTVSARGSHTAAIKTDGSLWTWGQNTYGQLGNGTGGSHINHTPAKIWGKDANNWKTVSAGYYHTTAIKEDGVLWSWGSNFDGQLGDATRKDRTTPVRVIVSGW